MKSNKKANVGTVMTEQLMGTQHSPSLLEFVDLILGMEVKRVQGFKTDMSVIKKLLWMERQHRG